MYKHVNPNLARTGGQHTFSQKYLNKYKRDLRAKMMLSNNNSEDEGEYTLSMRRLKREKRAKQ